LKSLYLVQHGEAKPEQEDPARPLTEKGREEAAKVAEALSRLGFVKVEKIIHSGKTRAKQTAEIMAEKLKPEKGIEEVEGIAPLDDPSKIIPTIEREDNLMICGHLPHLSRLASTLITGSQEKEVIKFRMAAAVALVEEEGKGWRVAWILTPEMAESLLKP